MSEQGKQAITDAAELGRPVAYLALKDGIPVYDRTCQRIGVVEHVVADEPTDIFEGLIVHTLPLPSACEAAIVSTNPVPLSKDVMYPRTPLLH